MRKWKTPGAAALLIILSVIFCLPYLIPLNRIIVEESYLQQCSYLDVNIISLLRNGGISFWAYHFGGGYPFIKHPENTCLSPLFYLLVVPFGSAAGMKATLVFSYLIGVAGFLAFARRVMKYDILASSVSAAFFLLGSFIPFQINTGNTRDQGWLYLPLAAYLLFMSKKDRRYVLFCAGLMTLLVLNGFNLYMVPAFLFLFLFSLLYGIAGPGEGWPQLRRLLNNFMLVAVMTFLLGAVKIFPLLELLRENIRGIDQYQAAAAGAMTFKKMLLAFFSRGPYAVGNEAAMGPNGLGMGSVMYFGAVPGLFFAAACVLSFKKVWKLLVLTGAFLCLSMADNCPLDVFHLLWRLPLFHSMREVARYFSFPAVFTVSAAAGAFLASVIFKRMSAWAKALIVVIALAGAADMFIANTQYFRFTAAYQEKVPPLRKDEGFFNVVAVAAEDPKKIPAYQSGKEWGAKYRFERAGGLQYYLLRQNIGMINWFGNIPLREKAYPRYAVLAGYGDYWEDLRRDPSSANGVFRNKKYKAEAFFAEREENKVKDIHWGNNRITVEVDQVYPDTLVINQNYDREWTAEEGVLHDSGGLLSVTLSEPVKGEVAVVYRPRALYAGSAVSLAALLAGLFYLFLRGLKNKVKPTCAG